MLVDKLPCAFPQKQKNKDDAELDNHGQSQSIGLANSGQTERNLGCQRQDTPQAAKAPSTLMIGFLRRISAPKTGWAIGSASAFAKATQRPSRRPNAAATNEAKPTATKSGSMKINVIYTAKPAV